MLLIVMVPIVSRAGITRLSRYNEKIREVFQWVARILKK